MGAQSSGLPVASNRQVRILLLRFWREYRARLLQITVIFGISAALGLASPRLVGLLIDRLSAGTTAGEIALYCGAMLACTLAQFVLLLTATRAALVLGEDVFAVMREEFMEGALRLPLTMLEQGGTGELLTRTTQDIGSISATVRRALPESLIAVVTVLFTLGAAFLTSPIIAPVFFLSVPLLLVALRWYLKRAGGIYQRLGASYGPVFASISETATGSRTVEALSLAEARARSMDEVLGSRWLAALARIRLRQVMLPWSNLAFAVPVFSSLAWGGWLAIQGTVSVGTVVSVTLFATALVAPLEALVRWTDELQKGFVSFARILGVSEAVEVEPRVPLIPKSDEVELQAVSFSYREGREVLHNVDLKIIPGERLAIVGPSGAGKSTIARLLAGLDDPDSGRALIGGVQAGSILPSVRHRKILLVSQESHIFATTIRENVLLARPDASDGELRLALASTGALEWVEALDRGWDCLVGAKGMTLSGAQEQQLALARVVLADPSTIILDEATSAMDPRAARRLEAALAAALEGRTVIAIAHRLYTAFDADRIAVVDAGRIVELGSHEELLAASGAYAQLWNSWNDDGASPVN